MHVSELNNVQKEMDKIMQQQRSTWDAKGISGGGVSDARTSVKNNNNNNNFYAATFTGCDNKSLKSAIKGSHINENGNKRQQSPHHAASVSSTKLTPTPPQQQQQDKVKSTATILVSKTKTKTGLPLMLKK